MSAAEKYGRPMESLSSETLRQVHEAGKSLAEQGVVHQSTMGTGAPAHTPAMKYGASGESLQRELPPPSRSR